MTSPSCTRNDFRRRSAWQRSSVWALIRRMNASHRLLPRGGARSVRTLALLLALPACGGSSSSGWPKENVVLHDENNYTSQTSLTLPKIPTASGADLKVCWDGLMKDLLCHNIAP